MPHCLLPTITIAGAQWAGATAMPAVPHILVYHATPAHHLLIQW